MKVLFLFLLIMGLLTFGCCGVMDFVEEQNSPLLVNESAQDVHILSVGSLE
jgi:hypothetical protein